MSDAQLKKLCANWRKDAKWYRGKGFTSNSVDDVSWRQCRADVFTQCAEELNHQLKKAKAKR